MKKINTNQVEDALENAIKTNKKSILFISHTLETRQINLWFKKHIEYTDIVIKPTPLRMNKNGKLVKIENSVVIANEFLDTLNKEDVIWYIYPFGDNAIYGFSSVIDAIKNRRFINDYGDGMKKEFSLEKLKLFIGLTTDPGDGFSLSEKYYDVFDEVYYIY